MAPHARVRRQHLGERASAALPALWKALARLDWSHSEFARFAEISTASATSLLYGDIKAGRRVSAKCAELGVRVLLWDKPCPPNWRPRHYPQHRKGARERAETSAAAE